jgi:P-type E1-E2 ATPase
MIRIAVPGLREYEIHHLVLDVNGTLAVDGQLIAGVQDRLRTLGQLVTIHLITADTHGQQASIDSALGLRAERLAPGNESNQKGRFVRSLGAASVVAIGNGANDVDMLRSAAVGIAVTGEEGLATTAHQVADVLAQDIVQALDLVLNPARISATLRR